MKNCISALLCLLLSCLLLIFASAQERPSLFLGDSTWQEDALLPFLEADGKQLVPVSVFGHFGIAVTYSEKMGSLLLEKDEKFLSFNLSFGTVLEESGTVNETDVYRYGGALYLDPNPVCEKFGLTFTTVFAGDGYLAARLCDGSESLTFSELLSLYADSGETPLPYLYNPKGKTVGGTFMYPMLLRPAAANVQGIVNLLGGHASTFVLSPADIAQYADVLPILYAGGHTVAYYFDTAKYADTADFLAEMENANAWLFAFLGKTVRVYVSPEPYATIPQIEGYFGKSCRMHLVVDDLASERVVNMTLSESPGYNIFNFSLASDRETRSYYTGFFKRFDTFKHLRAMPITEAGAAQ